MYNLHWDIFMCGNIACMLNEYSKISTVRLGSREEQNNLKLNSKMVAKKHESHIQEGKKFRTSRMNLNHGKLDSNGTSYRIVFIQMWEQFCCFQFGLPRGVSCATFGMTLSIMENDAIILWEKEVFHFPFSNRKWTAHTHTPYDVTQNRHLNKPRVFKMFVLLLNSKAITSHASGFGADFDFIQTRMERVRKKIGNVDVDVEKGLFGRSISAENFN